jgi:hypothetical protein
VLAQKTEVGQRPDPTQWRLIDFTSQISDLFLNGYGSEKKSWLSEGERISNVVIYVYNKETVQAIDLD